MAANSKGEPPAEETVREAVAVFHDVTSFEAAIDELQSSGFDRADISLLAGEKAVESKLGHRYEKAGELEDDAHVPRVAYVGRESVGQAQIGVIGGLAYVGAFAAIGAVVASGGTLAVALVGAGLAGGAGGLIGSAIAGWLGKHHAHEIESQLHKGGLLLWVHVRDPEHERKALEILGRHSADDVHVHALPRASEPAENPFSGVTVDPFLPGAHV